jgi:hypothetical protein
MNIVDRLHKRIQDFEYSMDEDYRKENGIYYTDTELAYSIIEFLELDTSKSLFEPNCGGGSFVLAAQRYNMTDIYAADIDSSAVKMCRQLTGLNERVIELDTIWTEPKDILKKFKRTEKFDYIIGNPPYVPLDKNITIDTNDYLFLRNVKDSGSNLFIGAILRALDLVKEDGIVSFIIPKNFLHVNSYKPLRKRILSEFTIHSVINIGSYFKNVRGEQIVLTLKNTMPQNNIISFCEITSSNEIQKVSEIEQNFYNNEILFFESDNDFKLYKKLESSYQKLDDICTGHVGRGKSKSENAIAGKDIRKFGFKNRKTPKKGNQLFIQNIYSAESGIIAAFGGNLEAKETVTIFTDDDEKMCRYVLGVLHSRLCNYYLLKFCFNNSKLTMHTDAKYLKKIPLVKNEKTFNQVLNLVIQIEKTDYMSEEWFAFVEALNDLIYKIYGISEDEIDYIDSEMRKIQSRIWFYDK